MGKKLILDKEWIEDKLKECNDQFYDGMSDASIYSLSKEIEVLKEILEQSTPLSDFVKPIVEKVFDEGSKVLNRASYFNQEFYKRRGIYITKTLKSLEDE